MILMTYRVKNGQTPPIYVRGGKGSAEISQIRHSTRSEPFQIAQELLKDMETCRNQDLFVYVAPGATVRPPLARLQETDYDVAAYVELVGAVPRHPGQFSGIGRIRLGTLAFRQSDAARRVLERWAARVETGVPDAAVALAISLREVQGVRFLHLPREYCLRAGDAVRIGVRPVVEHRWTGEASAAPAPVPPAKKPRSPEVLYSSHLRDYSGYAKASRNVLFRISNSLSVRVDNSDLEREPIQVDADTNRRIDAYTQTLISDRAPLFRFYTPKHESRKSYRICSTMMESQTLSPEFARLLNENYQEAFVPTNWNKLVFQEGGVRIPIAVVPLGVDPLVYKPGPKTRRQKAVLLTTSKAGAIEPPAGYAFVMVFQPTFRKNVDHLVAAFDHAFSSHPDDASLVLVTSVHAKLDQYGCAPFSRLRRGSPRSARSKIYHLTGTWSEWEMAALYRSFDCYTAASGAEGWDLPLCEAAACGLPVIATNCSSHTEILDGTRAWTYNPDGFAIVPNSGQVSRFYEGQKFAEFGDTAVGRLSDMLREAPKMLKKGSVGSVQIGHTWDRTAAMICEKLVKANES